MSNLSPFGGGKNPPWVRNTGKILLYTNIKWRNCMSFRVQNTMLPNLC